MGMEIVFFAGMMLGQIIAVYKLIYFTCLQDFYKERRILIIQDILQEQDHIPCEEG